MSLNCAGVDGHKCDPPIQRGFARHSAMLVPMTVKNIAITMMIADQAMTWIVAIARFAIFAPISLPQHGEAFLRPRDYLCWGSIDRGAGAPNDP